MSPLARWLHRATRPGHTTTYHRTERRNEPRQIEMWALGVIERVEAKQPIEDARVELKRDWPPDANKAARRLGGHANAARGEPILWLIGVDEGQGVVGATPTEPSKWFAGVQAEFDGLSPRITDVNVPWNGQTVVALLVETDRSPFVVKNATRGTPAGGPVTLEVPWREATAVRSATRADLLRLLAPLARLPDVEVLGASLWANRVEIEGRLPFLNWRLDLYVFVTPLGEERVVIPQHSCELWFKLVGRVAPVAFRQITLTTDSPLNLSSRSSASISSPGLVTLSATGETDTEHPGSDRVHVGGRLCPVRADTPIVIDIDLDPVPGRSGYVGVWAHGRYEGW